MPKQSQKQNKNKQRKQPRATSAVSVVSTAPVAIGNSVRGTKASVTSLVDGARIVGRDFAFSLAGTASVVTNWELVGGMPLTPCVLPSSVLRNYAQMFQYFKINSATLHYITSSATSQTGDIMFYYERDRKQPMVDYTNTSFLPFVLSDANTVIGPQWTNHTLFIQPVKEWKTTAFALNVDSNEDAIGSAFLFSKTSTTSSPGYVLIDYDISFKGMSVNPRAGQLPVSRGQTNQISLGALSAAVANGVTALDALVLRGNNLSNAVATTPTGQLNGDVYKASFCVTSSLAINTFTNVTPQTLLVSSSDIDTAIIVDDGFTCYVAVADVTVGSGTTSTYALYPTLEAALLRTGSYKYGGTATVTFAMIMNVELVISNANTFSQSSY